MVDPASDMPDKAVYESGIKKDEKLSKLGDDEKSKSSNHGSPSKLGLETAGGED